jgi:hypothetical protein
MSKKLEIKINSVLNGWKVGEFESVEGQFNFSRGIDPDLSYGSSSPKPTGAITPTAYAPFSGAEVNSYPVAIITTPKTALVYAVLANGKLISYNQTLALASENHIGTVAGDVAHGAFYYNNYIYITGTGAGQDDVSRYGPLDGTAALTDNVWKGATLGTQTGLANPPYPEVDSVRYPKHWGHVHSDNTAYFFDFVDGQGRIHAIKTTKGTAEGDTDDGSAYDVLDLPFGYKPTDIESYGKDLIISAIQIHESGTILVSGAPALFLWDTTDEDSFYRQIDLPELREITALQNKGGRIYVFGGNTSGQGYTVGVYDGAFGLEHTEFFPDGHPPLASAVAVFGNRISWGSKAAGALAGATPMVISMGYKNPKWNGRAIHSPAAPTGDQTTISALAYVQKTSGQTPRYVIGSRGDTFQRLSTLNTGGTQNSAIEFGEFVIGQPFKVTKIRILLDGSVSSGVNFQPLLLFDNLASVYALRDVDNSNYPGKRRIVWKRPELDEVKGGISAQGSHSFRLIFNYSGNILRSILLPITIELELLDD